MIMNIKDTDLTNVEAMLSDIINNSDYGLEEIAELCKSVGSPIKSIQRGTGTIDGSNAANRTKNITISSVNTSKSLVFISTGTNSGSDVYVGLYITLTNSTTITIKNNNYTNIEFSWQVVEFN